MKRFVSIFFTFLFLSLCFTINVSAGLQSRTFGQGIYSVRDTNLLVGSPLTARITPATSKAIIIVIDSDQTIKALLKLDPKVQQQILPPLDYDYSLIIFSNGSISFS